MAYCSSYDLLFNIFNKFNLEGKKTINHRLSKQTDNICNNNKNRHINLT